MATDCRCTAGTLGVGSVPRTAAADEIAIASAIRKLPLRIMSASDMRGPVAGRAVRGPDCAPPSLSYPAALPGHKANLPIMRRCRTIRKPSTETELTPPWNLAFLQPLLLQACMPPSGGAGG